MRYATACVALLWAAAMPATVFGAYDFQIDPRAGDFSYFRELDPGGGGNTYVVDHLKARFAIPAVPVVANTYHFRFNFPVGEWLEFSPQTQRIDFLAALGETETNYGVGSSAGTGQSSLSFDIENLSRTSSTGRTVTFYAAGSSTDAIGVGVDELLYVNGITITPGAPFRLRSLDVTFRIPFQFIPSAAPESPAFNIVLDIGAGANVQTATLPTLEPLVRAVPEPGNAMLLLGSFLCVLRRRHRSGSAALGIGLRNGR